MAGNSQKLNEGELALYSMHLSSGYIPVGVDLAARVFQVCYLTEKQKIKNKALSREAFLDFLKSPPFSQPLMVGFEACGMGSPCKPEYWLKNHAREVLSWCKYWGVKYLHLPLE